MKIALIGGGIMGSCTALELARRGHEVTVFEQFELQHQQGSSAGNSRIVRQAYPDPFYTSILLGGHPLWKALEADSGVRLMYEVGLLYFGPEHATDLQICLQGLEDLAVPHERLDAEEVMSRWQNPQLGENEVGLYTPEAGWVSVPDVLSVVHRLARREGAIFIHKRIETRDELAEFDRVIVTAGAWVSRFSSYKPDISLQTYAYVLGEYHGPVWIESGPHYLYGFPNEPGQDRFKVGVHFPGRKIDPDDPNREPDMWAIEVIADLARRRFGVESPRVVDPSTCPYTKGPGDDFCIFWEDKRTLVASPCSGHGFKFGPWIGQFLSSVLEEKETLDNWPRFLP